TFIQRWLEIFTHAAFGFVDGLVDNMARHLVFLGAVNQAAQGQVGRGVGTAAFGAHINFAAVAGIHFGFGSGRFGHGLFTVLIGATHRTGFFCLWLKKRLRL